MSFLVINKCKISFLADQWRYGLLDGITHLINLIVYSPTAIGFPLYCLWLFLFANDLFNSFILNLNSLKPIYANLLLTNGNRKEESQIEMFPWISFNYKCDHSNLNDYRKELLTILSDVIGHVASFFLGMNFIQSTFYKFISMAFLFLLYGRMIKARNTLIRS